MTSFHRNATTTKGDTYVSTHAKAASTGQSARRGTGLGSSIRGAFATRGGSLGSKGSGAPSDGVGLAARTPSLRLPAVAFLVVGLLTVFAAPALALPAEFGHEGTGAGAFNNPHGIAVDNSAGPSRGDVYLADTENNRIDKFGPEGEFLLAFGFGVADGTTEALQTCTTTCFPGLPGAGPGQLERPEGIAVDNSPGASHGDLYVADIANHRIEKFDEDGNFLLAFGTEGTGSGQFQFLTGRSVGVGPAGEVFVADSERVQRFSETGAPVSQFAVAGSFFIGNLAVDTTGDVYVAGELPGARKYDPGTGTELGSPRDETGRLEQMALATGPADQLFLNDYRGCCGEESHHLFAFDAAGKQVSSFDPSVADQGAFRGMAYSEPEGIIYAVNSGGTAIRILTPPPPGPFVLIGSESASEIFTTTATLGATVNPEGGAETKCRFQYVDAESFANEGGFASPNTEQTTPTELSGGEFEDQPSPPPSKTSSPEDRLPLPRPLRKRRPRNRRRPRPGTSPPCRRSRSTPPRSPPSPPPPPPSKPN